MSLNYSVTSLAQANEITGGLSYTSKMPCPSYSLPATACNVGRILATQPGSVCHKCYALKGRYRFGNVKDALERRLEAIYHPQWVNAMVYLIVESDHLHFRWHDSGDIQSVAHLQRICKIAHRLPQVRFWLPTRETGILSAFYDTTSDVPPNLTIRVSATMVDGKPSQLWAHTSTVVSDSALATCPAMFNDNECGTCRRCWDKSVTNVAYPLH